MQWGSQWQVATHAGFNLLCLCGCQNRETNPGGSTFKKDRAANPLLRVRPRQNELVTQPLVTDTNSSLTSTTSTNSIRQPERELVYATETFDRQQQDSERKADSRWLRRHRKHRVPAIDVRLVVAFQKVLREEEIEFMLLVAAIEADECCNV